MLDFLERHTIGILTTNMFHLLVITAFLILKIQDQKRQTETRIELDFAAPKELEKDIEEMKKEAKTLSEKEFIKNMEEQYLGSNIPKNEAEQDSKKSVDNMVSDIKDELNIKDYAQTEREKDAKLTKIEKVEKKEVKDVKQKPEYTTNAKGERIFDRGATTVSYYLEGRMHVYIPIPIYQCQGSGKVVLEILVNRNGYVLSAQINRAESQITEECLMEAATRAALTTRFNEKGSAPEKQTGKISYIFIAQ